MRNFLDKNHQYILNFASDDIGADFYPPIKMSQKSPFFKQNESLNRTKAYRHIGLNKQQESEKKESCQARFSE